MFVSEDEKKCPDDWAEKGQLNRLKLNRRKHPGVTVPLLSSGVVTGKQTSADLVLRPRRARQDQQPYNRAVPQNSGLCFYLVRTCRLELHF